MASIELGSHVAGPMPLKPHWEMNWKQLFYLVPMVVLAVLAVVALSEDNLSLAGTLGGLAVGFALIGLIPWGMQRFGAPATLDVYEEGVCYRKGQRQLRIPYSQVKAVTIRRQPVLANGEPKGMVLRTQLWRRDPAQQRKPTTSFTSRFADDDPHLPVFLAMNERLLDRLAENLRNDLATGKRLAIGGCQVDANYFRHQTTQVPMSEIVAAAVFQNKACFWRKGERHPFVRLPIEQPNVPVLLNHLVDQLDARGEIDDGLSKDPLGRVLFSRRPFDTLGVLALALCGLLLVPVLVGIFFLAFNPELEPIVRLAILLFLIPLAGAMAWVPFRLRKMHFSVHQRGISQCGRLSSRALGYEQMAGFTYQATRQFYNGAYIGTSMKLQFSPVPGQKKVSYSTTVKGVDDDLELLRDHVSKVLARQLYEEIRRSGGEVAWRKDVAIAADGLRYRKGKLLGKGEAVLLPWDQVHGYNLNDGNFFVFAKEEEKAVVTLPVSGYNFFPCMYLFMALWAEATEGQDAAEATFADEPRQATARLTAEPLPSQAREGLAVS